MTSEKCRFDGRAAAVALVRWALGVLFLCAALGKIGHVGGFVNGFLLPKFHDTFLSTGMLTIYGYGLPFVELTLGICLLLGLFRNVALFVAGLTLISLAFGMMLIREVAVVSANLTYASLAAATLFLGAYDRWTLGNCWRGAGRCEAPAPGAGHDVPPRSAERNA